MQTTDLIIIGSGPGGYRAAAYAAKKGLRVVIIEKAALGGTCLNSGCIPTKTLCHHAEIAQTCQNASAPLADLAAAFTAAMARKREVVENLAQGIGATLSSENITVVRGEARFTGAKTVEVAGCADIEDNVFTAENVIIATGSVAKLPPVEGIDLPHVLTSTELLDIDHVPQRLCIVGAGVIGMEMAAIFNAFGSKVTVVEFLKECLPAMDSDLAKRLRKKMEKDGIDFFMQCGVRKITEREVVFTDKKGREQSVEADTVLVATGRAANLSAVPPGLEADRYIAVDDNMQTAIPGVYAIGDVNGRCLLAHAATFQGFRAVDAMLVQSTSKVQSAECRVQSNTAQPNSALCTLHSALTINSALNIMPAAVFTTPELASVGPTEEQLKAQGVEYRTQKSHYRSNGRAHANDCADGLLKLLVSPDERILACHVLGSHAADIVQEAAVLMNFNATLSQLRAIVHIHPTLAEALHEAAFL